MTHWERPGKKGNGERRGRRLLLTVSFIARAAELSFAGLIDRDIYRALGVSSDCFYRWISIGRAEHARVDGVRESIEASEVEEKPGDVSSLEMGLGPSERMIPYYDFYSAVRTSSATGNEELLNIAREGAISKPDIALRLLAQNGYDLGHQGVVVNNQLSSSSQSQAGVVNNVIGALTDSDVFEAAQALATKSMERMTELAEDGDIEDE